MARIRTIKPEFFRHETLFEAEMASQLPLRVAFAGLFTCCDREGRFRWRPRQLKLDILPYDTVDFTLVLEVLSAGGFIIKYCIEGNDYGYIPSWSRHQVINTREAKSELPEPPQESVLLSLTPHTHDACSTREARVGHASRTCTRGKGREREEERKGKEQTSVTPARLREANHATTTVKVNEVFTHWQQVMQHPQAKLDNKRQALIQKSLQAGYSVAQLCEAIRGCSMTPHNMGDNERGQRYDGLHVILRDADQIDRFIHNYHHPPQQRNATERQQQANQQVLQDWLMQKQQTSTSTPTQTTTGETE
jgi:hypothetical protein